MNTVDSRTLDNWQFAQMATDVPEGTIPDPLALEWRSAVVPGAIQYDLVRAGELENPFASTEAARRAAWVAESDWCYRTEFDLDRPEADLALDVPGIDTYSELWLNGSLVGNTANNYRRYRFPLPSTALRAGRNELLIRVKAHRRMVADQREEARSRLSTTSNQRSFDGKSLLRRYQRSFLSGNSSLLNLGAEILGIGINRPVSLVAIASTRVENFHFQVNAVSPNDAKITVSVDLVSEKAREGLAVRFSLVEPDTECTVASEEAAAVDGRVSVGFTVTEPRLWWPRGYGDPYRYRLVMQVLDGHTIVAEEQHLVGIRSVEVLRSLPSGRPTFQFVVNGTPIYVRGHNLVPLDYVQVHRSWPEYARALQLVCDSNANLIRIWGGGMTESATFYDALDANGIMLWQDFYLHSTTYPDYDSRFTAEFRQESRELALFLRNHPCLVVLCGGNEQDEGWDEWGWQGDLEHFYGSELAHKVAADVAAEIAPEVPFIPNSPHGQRRSQSPVDGDMHCWGNFYNATKDPVFVTETCWNLQSYSSAKTLAETMGLEVDEYSERGWPARWKSRTELSLVTKLPYSGYNATRTLREYLEGLEIEHLLADHHALSMLRLHSPACRGIVYWPLNKGAPLFEFGCVDYALRPLMNYYAIKRLFADIAIGLHRDADNIGILGSNLSPREVHGTLTMVHADATGRVLAERTASTTLQRDWRGRILGADELYEGVIDRTREVVHAAFVSSDGTVRADDTLFFCPLAEYKNDDVSLTVELIPLPEGGWQLEVASSAVVKLLQLEGDGLLFSDNYFALFPSDRRRIGIKVIDGALAADAVTVRALGASTVEHLKLP